MPVNLREKTTVHKAAHAAPPRWLLPAAWRVGAAVLGLLGARAPLMGGARPLGLCFAVCVPAPFALWTAGGAAAGYGLSLAPELACPYLVAAAGAALLRGFARVRHAQEAPMSSAVAACLIFFFVQCGFAVTGPDTGADIIAAVAASALTLGLSCMLTNFFSLPRPTDALCAVPDPEQRAAACFGYMALLACLTPCALFSLSAAHITAALAVLLAACRGGPGAAAVLGAASMLTLCAADPASLYAGFAITVGGLAASLFAGASRGGAALVFCAAGLVGVQGAPSGEDAVRLGVTLCCAGGAVCLLPARLLRLLPSAPPVAAPPPSPAENGQRAAASTLSARLAAVSGALCTVGDTMRAVCKHMPPRYESFADLCDAAAERCCRQCEKRLSCWVDEGGATRDALCALTPQLTAGREATPDDLPEPLRSRCIFPLRLTGALNAAAGAQRVRRAARVRADSMRTALCEQYAATASALTALAGEVFAADLPDRRKAHRLEQMFTQLGLEPIEVCAALNESGRLSAAVSLPRTMLTPEELAALTEEAAALFHRAFLPVQCEESGAVTRLVFREAPRYRVECAVSAMGAREGVCADAVRTFHDAAGRFVAVLCDGMGTGKRAAVGGALAASLACELLRAGVDCESAARLVNIALGLKGDDENAVTLDVLSIDLYTGEAWLYKAGAAASFVLHSGACEVYSSDTLPIGILEKVSGRRERVSVSAGDTAVLVSDGALVPGAPWLRAELLARRAETPRRLADAAARAAWDRQHENPDDVTVVAVRLLENA